MEGRISQPPERGGEIVIQQASDDCQAVLLHCRCDANIHSSFSSLRCVILLPVLPSAPSSSPFLSSFPLLVSPAVFLPCMPLLTLWAFLFLFLLLFIYLFTSLASHIPVLPLLFFFPLSILSVEMSGWSEALCPGDCCAIRFSDGPDFVCMSVCTWRALTQQEKWTFPFIQA